jgi:hypothetical protein
VWTVGGKSGGRMESESTVTHEETFLWKTKTGSVARCDRATNRHNTWVKG